MDGQPALGIVEILGIAASASLLAGWRLYLVVLATGIAMRSGAVPLPEHLPAAKKKYHLARDVGHYGIFNGSKWRTRIAPVVEEWIRANAR